MTHAIGTNHALPNSIIDQTDKQNAVAIRNSEGNSEATTVITADASSVSGTANLLSQAVTAAKGDDVRADKVASIRAAIESGTYAVPASAVADSLITTMLG